MLLKTIKNLFYLPLKATASSDAMKSLLKTGIRAGAIAGVTTGLGIAAPSAPSSVQEAFAPDRIMQHLQHQGFTQAVGCSIDAIMGDKHAFHRFGANVAAGTVGAVGAGAIGLGLKDNPVIHKLAHGILGAATGSMLGGKDGAVAGAMGAIVAETVVEVIQPHGEIIGERVVAKAEAQGLELTDEELNHLVREETKGYQAAAKLSAALVSGLAARDVNISADVATTALENNNAITMGIVVGVSRAVQAYRYWRGAETIAKAATHIKETTDARIDADKATNTRGGGGSAGGPEDEGPEDEEKSKTIERQTKCPEAKSRLDKKLSELEKAQSKADKTETLPDGRIRFYEKERLARTEGPTRGNARVTEYNPKTGQVRSWEESYNHSGEVTRVHPKSLDGGKVESTHYPLTAAERGL